jgi:hypothetical protein
LALFLLPVVSAASAPDPGTDPRGALERLARLAHFRSGGGGGEHPTLVRHNRRLGSEEATAGELCLDASPAKDKAFCDVELDLTALKSMLPPGTPAKAMCGFIASSGLLPENFMPVWQSKCCVSADCAICVDRVAGATDQGVCANEADLAAREAEKLFEEESKNSIECDFPALGASVTHDGPRNGSSWSYIWKKWYPSARGLSLEDPSPIVCQSNKTTGSVNMTMNMNMTYAYLGSGFCNDRQYLPEGGYPAFLHESSPLHDFNRTTECMNRCLDAYPSSQAFFTKISGECACSKGTCSELSFSDAEDYRSYRINNDNRCASPSYWMLPQDKAHHSWEIIALAMNKEMPLHGQDSKFYINPSVNDYEERIQMLAGVADASWNSNSTGPLGEPFRVHHIEGTATFPKKKFQCKLQQRMTVKTGKALSLEGWRSDEESRSVINGNSGGRVLFHVFGSLTLKNMVMRGARRAVLLDGAPSPDFAEFSEFSRPPSDPLATLILRSSSFIGNVITEKNMGDVDAIGPVVEDKASRFGVVPPNGWLNLRGAGISACGGRIVFDQGTSVFRDNVAGQGGAGVLLMQGAKMEVAGANTRVLFEKNTVPAGTLEEINIAMKEGRGAGIFSDDGKIIVSDHAKLDFVKNRAPVTSAFFLGTSHFEYFNTSLLTVESNAKVTITENEHCALGALHLRTNRWMNEFNDVRDPFFPDMIGARANMIIRTGGKVEISKNVARCLDAITAMGIPAAGGGFYLDSALFVVEGFDSLLLVQENHADVIGGGGLLLTTKFRGPNDVIVKNGGMLLVRNNSAGQDAGGLALVSGADLLVAGIGSRIEIAGNSAGSRGAGLFLQEKASCLVTDNSKLIIAENVAGTAGAGVFVGLHSSLKVVDTEPWMLKPNLAPELPRVEYDYDPSDKDTVGKWKRWKWKEPERQARQKQLWEEQREHYLEVRNNVLTNPASNLGGAGIFAQPGTEIRVSKNSLFEGNTAEFGQGGAIGMSPGPDGDGRQGSW